MARLDIPDKVTGRFTYMQDFKRKGMLHARVVRPTGDEGDAPVVERFRLPQDSRATSASCKKGNFLAVLGRTEWAAIAREPRDRDDMVGLGRDLPDQAKLWEYVRNTKSQQGRGAAESRRRGRGAEDAGREDRHRDLRLRDPHARLDRAVVRGRRVQGRQADVLERVAADAPAAQADREHARA